MITADLIVTLYSVKLAWIGRGGYSEATDFLLNRVKLTWYDLSYLEHNPCFHWLIKSFGQMKLLHLR